MWLEPEQEWSGGLNKGYDLRSVTHLSFWARTDPEHANIDPDKTSNLKVFFGLREGDSCGRVPSWDSDGPYDGLWISLATEWTYHVLPVALSFI